MLGFIMFLTRQMTEMNYIVRNAGPGSLVIIDELCNETAADQGSAICWSICEALMMTEAWVMIATHTPLITKLQDLYFNVTKSVTSSSCYLDVSYSIWTFFLTVFFFYLFSFSLLFQFPLRSVIIRRSLSATRPIACIDENWRIAVTTWKS